MSAVWNPNDDYNVTGRTQQTSEVRIMSYLLVNDLLEAAELDQRAMRDLMGGIFDINTLFSPKVVAGTSGAATNVQAVTFGTIGGAFSGGVVAFTGPEANILGSFKVFG